MDTIKNILTKRVIQDIETMPYLMFFLIFYEG